MKKQGHFGEKTRHALQGRGIQTKEHKLVARGEDDSEYNERNRRLLETLQDLKNGLTEEIDRLLEEQPRYINDKERKIIHDQFGFNITGSGVIVCDDEDILILSETANKNWRYYAGFEYIKDNPPARLGEYYIYHRDDSERVADVLDSIHQIER